MVVHLVGPLKLFSPLPTEGNFIFIDGGLHHKNFRLGLSVGDGDSAKEGILPEILLPSNKDYSDFKAALDLIAPQTKTILGHGLIGGRWDHQLAILFEIHHWLMDKRDTTFQIDPHFTFFSAGTYKRTIQGPFAIFVFAPTKVELLGDCTYHLQQSQSLRPLSSQGISNSGHGEIDIVTQGPLVLTRGEFVTNF